MENDQKSLKKNIVLNSIKTLMTLVFPLITFPYASRILHVVNIGKVSYAASIASYFILIANLGIVNYSIREGTKIRDNKEKMGKFASEIFSLNIFSSIMSYILFFIVYMMFGQLHEYKWLLLIQSIPVILNAFTLDWIFSVYEDYLYITVRSILVQAISIVLLLMLVHTPGDVYIYSLIMIFSSIGGFTVNYYKARKYCDMKFTLSMDRSRKREI